MIVKVSRWDPRAGLVLIDAGTEQGAHLKPADEFVDAALADDRAGFFESWRGTNPDADWVLTRRIAGLEAEMISEAEEITVRWPMLWAVLVVMAGICGMWAAIGWLVHHLVR